MGFLIIMLMVFGATIILAPEAFETGVAATRAVRAAEIRSVSINGTSISSSNYKIAKDGCNDTCGNLSIPYPFGMGSSNCYRDYRFEITCNYSNSPPVASIISRWTTTAKVYEILEVTLDYVRISTPVRALCDDRENMTSTITASKIFDFSTGFPYSTQFTISDTLNKLTVTGCNTYGSFRQLYSVYDTSGYSTNTLYSYQMASSGCASFCTNGYIGFPSPCVGNGCCKVSIPSGVEIFEIQVTRTTARTPESYDIYTEPCIHAFVAAQDFSGVDDLIFSRDDSFVPLILEWAVKNFSEYDENKVRYTYACGKNTDHLEYQNGLGYRCKCSKGYEGNPYLEHGCQDVDECKEPHKCGYEVLCTNTQGSYNCSCSPGKELGISSLGYHCTPDKRRLPTAALVASGTGVSIIVMLMVGIGYWFYKRLEKRNQMKLKQKHFERNGGLLLKQKITSNDGRVEKSAKIFVTEELKMITDNFNPSRIIGKGGFGTVYKGMLSNGELVAIKKSTLVDENQVDQFINEVVILSQINHRHIVKLLGCCLETQVPLLVYEFVSSGTLSYHLQVEQEDSESLLSWKDRVRIASEVAGALAYLHSDASVPIFHRDIKSTNILLDEKYKAKVSDFGISRSIPIDKTHLTTFVQGTFGYLDPEYFHSSQFTDKSDVYSFGVVLVELLTGEQAISQIRHEEEKGLAFYFIKSMKENRLFEILDDRVCNEADKDDVLVAAKVAKRCLKYVGKRRPTMKEVSHILDGLHEKLSKYPLH